MKKRKVWIIAAVVTALLAGGGGLWYYLAQHSVEPVYVYGFLDGTAGMTDYRDSGNESYGMVTTDKIQPVYLSGTQTILEMKVSEGQSVKKGDVLFTYDTTLSDLELMKKDLAVQQAELDLQTAKRELNIINSYVPISYHEVVVPEPTEPEEPVEDLTQQDVTGKDYLPYSGSGKTSLTPKYCWLRSGAMVDENMMANLFSGTSENVLFVKFQHTEGDAADGAVTEEYGVKMMRLTSLNSDGSEVAAYRYSFFNPNQNPGGDQPIDDGIDWNSGYTAAEIASMRAAKQQEIKDLEFKIKMEAAELKIMQKEADSGEVTAEFDGVVESVLDPETAQMEQQPVLKVSGGGGYYVSGFANELELKNIQIGQSVQIMCWDNGTACEGTVVEIGQFPEEGDRYNYGVSQNVSYYPYKVFIDGSVSLQDGNYVSMTLQAGGEESSGLYIQNFFLRSEGVSSYVYVRNAEGLLEKRPVKTGTSLGGSYTEIVEGLTADDFVAFPYGKTVKEGVPTQEGTWDNLYQ